MLRVLALVLAIPLALFGIAIAVALFMNDRAERGARSLCSSISVGSAEDAAVTLGRAKSGRHSQAGSEHKFFFQGWVFNGAECVVRVNAGKVVSTETATIED